MTCYRTIGNLISKMYTKRQLIIILPLCIGTFCNAMAISVLAPFYPKKAEDKKVQASLYGFVFGIYYLIIFLFSPIYGKFLNVIGATFMVNVGLFTTGVSIVCFGLLEKVDTGTTFFALSLILRILEALGYAAYYTSAGAIIAKEFPNDEGTAFSYLETILGVGLIFGPPFGAFLYTKGGFMLPFILLGSLIVIACLFSMFVLPKVEDTSGVTLTPKEALSLLQYPSIILGAASVFGGFISISYMQATLEPHVRPFKLDTKYIGLLFIVHGTFYGTSAPIWGKISDRWISPWSVCLIGAVLIVTGIFIIGPVPIFPIDFTIQSVVIGLCINAIGIAASLVASFSGMNRDAVAIGFPDTLETKGIVSGVWTSFFALGGFIGSSFGGLLYDRFGFIYSSFFVSGFHCILSFLLCVRFLLSWKHKISHNGDNDQKSTLIPCSGSPDQKSTISSYSSVNEHCNSNS